jgi:hypothetical protein
MTPLQPAVQPIGAMSSSRVFLGELLSSRARLRFPGHPHPQPTTPVRQQKPSERHTGTSAPVSLHGFTSTFPKVVLSCLEGRRGCRKWYFCGTFRTQGMHCSAYVVRMTEQTAQCPVPDGIFFRCMFRSQLKGVSYA